MTLSKCDASAVDACPDPQPASHASVCSHVRDSSQAKCACAYRGRLAAYGAATGEKWSGKVMIDVDGTGVGDAGAERLWAS